MNSNMFNFIFAAVVLIISLVTLSISYDLKTSSTYSFISDFTENFASELLGMFITVGVLDALIALRNQKLRLKKIASEYLIEINYIFWIWQGGKNDLDIDKLIAKIYHLDINSPLEKSTLISFSKLSLMAKKTLLLEHKLIEKNIRLKKVLLFIKKIPDAIEAMSEKQLSGDIDDKKFLENKIELCYNIIRLVEIADLPNDIIKTTQSRLKNTISQTHNLAKIGQFREIDENMIKKPTVDDSKDNQKKRFEHGINFNLNVFKS